MGHYKGIPCDQDLSDSLHLSRCAVNAETMQTMSITSKKQTNPKQLQSLAAELVAWKQPGIEIKGHKPVIYEKSDVLGGVFIPGSAESYKGKLRELLEVDRRKWRQ